jgi:hypothetical protein
VITSNSVSVRLSIDLAGTLSPVSRFFQGPQINAGFGTTVGDGDILSTVHKADAALATKMCG